MLTESEILDEQVQTLDCALDKLEAHEQEAVTPAQVDDIDAGHAVQVAVECLKATVDLYHTISNEGVSADDIKALRNIRNKIAPYMTLPVKVALEDYEGMFTPSRSMINQVVSQEATLAEIGTTLKEWFFKFVDFLIKVVDWCRLAWNSEEAINLRLKAIDHNLQSMYNAFEDVLKRNKLAGRDLYPELTEISKIVLHDPKLPRTESMLVAFGVKGAETTIVAGDKDVDKTFVALMKDVASLKTHVEQNKPMAMGYDFASDINVVAEALEDLHVADDDVDFFMDRLGVDFWMKPKVLLGRIPYPASHNIRQVQLLSKEFRNIRRNVNFDQLKEVDVLVQTIENITGSVKGLERMITFKQNLFTDYYKASATLANFYIRGHDLLLEQIITHGDEDVNKVVVTKLRKTWEDITKKMGIY